MKRTGRRERTFFEQLRQIASANALVGPIAECEQLPESDTVSPHYRRETDEE